MKCRVIPGVNGLEITPHASVYDHPQSFDYPWTTEGLKRPCVRKRVGLLINSFHPVSCSMSSLIKHSVYAATRAKTCDEGNEATTVDDKLIGVSDCPVSGSRVSLEGR